MKVCDWMAQWLADKGCTHAFGIVGGANLAMFEAISRRMTMVSVCHEQAAAIAAKYYYQTCRRIAPVLVTAGGGSANAITGVIEAHMDSIPLLVISGNELSRFINAPKTRTIGFQGFRPEHYIRESTKGCMTVDNALGLKYTLEKFYETALEPRQGAVWVDVPQNIAAGEME